MIAAEAVPFLLPFAKKGLSVLASSGLAKNLIGSLLGGIGKNSSNSSSNGGIVEAGANVAKNILSSLTAEQVAALASSFAKK